MLWGAAALVAAGSATAYALNRRKQRQAQIEERRREIVSAASPQALRTRLTGIWNQAQARVAPIRAGMLAAAAAAARAAQELHQCRKVQYRLAEYQDSLLRLEPPTTPVEQTVAWRSPDAEMNATYRLGRIYSSPQLRGELPPWRGPGTPTPVQIGTPVPYQPTPARVPIAPYPPGYLPSDPDLFSLQGKWLGRGGSLLNAARNVSLASAVQYTVLEGGRFVISAPSLAWGTRAERLSRYFLRGGPYTGSTLSQVGLRAFSLRNLAAGAKGTIGIGLATSLISNLWDYTVGAQRQTGVVSREFAVSTGVDLVMGVGTGLVAAGTVAVGAAVVAATVGLTAPVWATVAGAAILAVGIGWVLDRIGVGAELKRRVNEGLDAVPGILQNGRIIAQVVGERVSDAASNAVRSVSNTAFRTVDAVQAAARDVIQLVAGTAHDVGEAVGGMVGSAAGTVQQLVRDVVQSGREIISGVQNTVSQAFDSAKQFLGNLFGGGD